MSKHKKAKVIAICNQKGGVGKTTTTVNCGIGLAKLGKKVLLIDLDSQANLTMCLGFEPDSLSLTVTDLIDKVIINCDSSCIENEKDKVLLQSEGVDLIPSDIRLSGIENSLINTYGRERILESILKQYVFDYDFILIDCQPSLNLVTINALVAANSVLIPVQTHFLSAKGLEMLLLTIGKVKKLMNPSLSIEGILFTMYDVRTKLARNVVNTLRENYGENIHFFKNYIPMSVKAVETSAIGKSIFKHNPNGPVALRYEMLAKEVLEANVG